MKQQCGLVAQSLFKGPPVNHYTGYTAAHHTTAHHILHYSTLLAALLCSTAYNKDWPYLHTVTTAGQLSTADKVSACL